MRLIAWALVVCVVVVVGATAVGRAVDAEIRDRVIFTQNGVTLDCERYMGVGDETAYGDCHTVP